MRSVHVWRCAALFVIFSALITVDLHHTSFAAPAAPTTIGSSPCTTTVSTTVGITASRVGNDCVLSFTSTTTYTWTSPPSVTAMQFLIIGGGGGGGSRHSGGGGAGGMLISSSFTVTPLTSYSISVGAGGAGLADGNAGCGNAGSPSTFGTVTANGGGPGCNPNTSTAGGSSGGTGNDSSTPGAATPGSVSGTSLTNAVSYASVTGYGKRGGKGWPSDCQVTSPEVAWCGGGGGGAGGTGKNATTEGAGLGGAGLGNDITGTLQPYAGGGGGSGGRSGACGGVGADGAVGGSSIGGNGGGYNNQVTNAGNGTANTGSGGGGGAFCDATNFPGGSGGSGIVIMRWTPDTTSPAVSAWTPPTTPTNNRTVSFGLSLNESVTDLASNDFSNSGTATCSFSPNNASGTTFTITATCTTDGTVIPVLDINTVADLTGNTGPAGTSTSTSVTIDTAAPTVTWGATPTYPNPLVARFTFTTSESVSEVSAADFTASGVATPCTLTVSASSGASFTVDATCTRPGTAKLQLASSSITDAPGNNGPASSSDSPEATIPKLLQTTLEVTTSTVPYGRATILNSTGGLGSGAVTFEVASGTCTIATGTSLTPGVVGSSCVVKARKAADSDYEQEVSSNATLTITKGTQTGFAISSTATFNAGDSHALTATGGQGTGAVTWSVTAGLCTLTSTPSGTTLNATNGGTTCTIEATRSGGDNYLPATDTQTITVATKSSASELPNSPTTTTTTLSSTSDETTTTESTVASTTATSTPATQTPATQTSDPATTSPDATSSPTNAPIAQLGISNISSVTRATRNTSTMTTSVSPTSSSTYPATELHAAEKKQEQPASTTPLPETDLGYQRNTTMTIFVLMIAVLLALLAGRPLFMRLRQTPQK